MSIRNDPARTAWWLLLLLLLADRLALLSYFGWMYTGTDDVVMWIAAQDYLRGIFREPCFYGQDYNFMLEALLAAPLLPVMPHHMALPLATSLLALLPWVAFAWVFQRRGQTVGALVFLMLPLAMPVEFGILTTLSRGFVTGLAAMALLAGVLLRPEGRRAWVLLGLATGLGVALNPNCLVFAVPVALYLWLVRRPGWRDLLFAAVAGLPFLLLQHLAKGFYAANPEHHVHWMMPLAYDPTAVWGAMGQLDRYFAFLTPVWWSWGWGVLVLLIVLAGWLWRLDRRAAWAIAGGLLATLLMLGVNKVSDGLPTLFHSSSRMFIGLPLVLALGLALGVRQLDEVRAGRWRSALLGMGLVVFSVKVGVMEMTVERHTMKEDQGPVAVTHLERLHEDLVHWQAVSDKHGVDLIVVVPDWKLTTALLSVRAYGAEVQAPSLPPAMLHVGDRRTWLYQAHRDAVHGTVLLYGHMLDWERAGPVLGCDMIRPGEHMVLVHNNTRSTRDLLAVFGVPMKRHIYVNEPLQEVSPVP